MKPWSNGQHLVTKNQALEKKSGSKTKKKGKKKRRPQVLKPYTQEFLETRLDLIHNIKLADYRAAAPLSEMLQDSEGGLPEVLKAMRFSADPVIVEFLRTYDKQTEADQKFVPWEAWAIKTGLSVQELLGSILIAMRANSVNKIKVLAISHHPDTVMARIKAAKTPKGTKDRDSLDTSLGFLPSQKGSTFIGKYFVTTQGKDPEVDENQPTPARPDEMDVNDIFPDLSVTQKLLNE